MIVALTYTIEPIPRNFWNIEYGKNRTIILKAGISRRFPNRDQVVIRRKPGRPRNGKTPKNEGNYILDSLPIRWRSITSRMKSATFMSHPRCASV